MNAWCGQESRVSSSRLRFPSTRWNLIVHRLSLVPLGEIWSHDYAVSTGRSAAIFCVCSHNCHASPRQTGILLRHIVHSDLENKAVSKDLGIVSLQNQQGSSVYCSSQGTNSVPHAGHTVRALHSAGLWWNPLPEPLTYGHCSWLPFFFPCKGVTRGHPCRGHSFLGKHESHTSLRLTLDVVYEESRVTRGNALQPYQHRSARLRGPQVNSSCKHHSLTLSSEGQNVSQIFLALLTGKGRYNPL